MLNFAQTLIRIRSLTPITADLLPEAIRSLDVLQEFAEAVDGTCERLRFSGGHPKWGYEVDNLFAHWPGDREAGHICFIGHTDVVPPGDLNQWQNDPFSGDVEGDLLKGRGATDMKGAIAAFCHALCNFLGSNPRVRPTITFVITSDEEWAAVNGTRRVLEWMHRNSIAPDYFLIGEPSSPEAFGTHIKVGRRGSLNGTLKGYGIQGHTAYPGLFINPNRLLVQAITAIQSHSWNDASDGMPATAFEITAYRSGDFNQTAIIPGLAEALWNIRFTPRQNPVDLVTLLQNLLETVSGEDTIGSRPKTAKIVLDPNLESVSMPYYSPVGNFARLVADAVTASTGLLPAIDATGGTTDGRFVLDFFPNAQVVELGLPEAGGNRVFGDRGGMHQTDECCSIQDLERLAETYQGILERIVRDR